MKTLLATAIAVALAATAADTATLCARKSGRPAVRSACRAGERRIDARVCARKKGQLVLRPACRAGERPFDTTAFAVTGGDGPTGAPGLAGEPARFPVAIVDSNQREVGEIELITTALAAVRIQGGPLAEPVIFYVIDTGFSRSTGASNGVFYTGTDCAGEPYMDDDVSGLARAQVVGTAAYYSRAPQIAELQVESGEFDNGGAPCPTGSTATTRSTCCTNASEKATYVHVAVRVDLPGLGFVPPFRAVAR